VRGTQPEPEPEHDKSTDRQDDLEKRLDEGGGSGHDDPHPSS
jgi:hypothetical protein